MDREDEVKLLEREVETRERELARLVADIEEDLHVVSAELSEARLQLEEKGARSSSAAGEIMARLAATSVPAGLPLEGHTARLGEVRADHARARLWLVSTLESELARFKTELGALGRLAQEARSEVSRLAEQPQARPSDQRLARVQTYEAEPIGLDTPDAKRRQMPRLRFEVAIDLHSRSNFYTGVTENISEGGLFIATEERLPLGTEVELAFTLPAGQQIRAHGVVRWTREPAGRLAGGIGIGFEGLSEAAYEAIGQFLERRAPIVPQAK